jgi:hypothetical protein
MEGAAVGADYSPMIAAFSGSGLCSASVLCGVSEQQM